MNLAHRIIGISQKQSGIVQYPYLTYGTFSTNLTPVTRYGLPFAVEMGGVVMDIDKILHTKVEVNNDREKLTAYNLSRGPSYSFNDERGYNKGLGDPCPSARVKLCLTASP